MTSQHNHICGMHPLTTELQYAVGGNPKKPKLLCLASQLGVIIDLFPDWETNWKADRDLASRYRNYLVHEGLVYTVRNKATGETLVLGRAAFADGVNWKQAEESYITNPGHWRKLEKVCHEVFEETVAFIDLTYERLLSKMDVLLTNPAYQRLWGWDNNTSPATMPAPVVMKICSMCTCSSMKEIEFISIQDCSASSSHKTIISSGPCMP